MKVKGQLHNYLAALVVLGLVVQGCEGGPGSGTSGSAVGAGASDLKQANTDLTRRLADALNDLYAATAEDQRDALLMGMLQDDLAAVRLVGVRLARQRAGGGTKLSPELVEAVRAGASDADAAVRQVATVLLGSIGNEGDVALLARRLGAEKVPEVRRAIYEALGHKQDLAVWDLLVKGISERDLLSSAAAATALARVVEKNGVNADRHAAAVKALAERYTWAPRGGKWDDLHEALLGAMGAMKDKRLAPLLRSALRDRAARLRLSAVKGLHLLGDAAEAKYITPLAGDGDRGVRLAAIAAIGALGGPEHLDDVMSRTGPAESDAAVREQAWAVAMSLAGQADVARLGELATQLTRRGDAQQYLVEALKLWAEKIPPDQVDAWSAVRLRLCDALLAADRPAEATKELAAVHGVLVNAGKPSAPAVRRRWIEALLTADDASAIAKIAETSDGNEFAAAVAAMQARIEALRADEDWSGLIRLTSAAERQLAERLDQAQREALAATLKEARAQQRQADRRRVSVLVGRITGDDEAAGAAARKELIAMNGRAVGPLVTELKTAATAKEPPAGTEKAIVDLLASLAPQLKGYDTKSPLPERVKIIDSWLEQLGGEKTP